MILTVTLNPCIDKSSSVGLIRPESKLRCTEVVREAGGGGINVSKALQRLGVPTMALFPAGGHNGNMLCSLLKKSDINFRGVDTHVETRENWIVMESSSNHQYRFTFPGQPVEESVIKTLINEIRSFSPSYVVASGSLPLGLPDYFYGMIIKTAQAVGAKCIVDTSGSALEAIKDKKAFLIKPNMGEISRLLKIEKLEKNEADDAAQQLIQNGYAEIVVVSMGAEGAWLVCKDEKHWVTAPSVEKKSTVGAGDSMVAGIVFALQKNLSLKEALQWGVACGSAATMNSGTQLFNKEDAFQVYNLIHQNA